MLVAREMGRADLDQLLEEPPDIEEVEVSPETWGQTESDEFAFTQLAQTPVR